MSDVIEATAVEEPGTDVTHTPAPSPSTLFRTSDPAQVLKAATATANALAPVLRERGMLSEIEGRDYVRVEGWTTLGSMLGVTPVGVWTHKLENGWEAKVNAQTLDGRVIGSAEAMCTRAEKNWEESDEYAIRSMAQTRAASKALASVLRFVVTLAGFSGTPAEEMDGVKRSGGGSGPRKPSSKQLDFLETLVKEKVKGDTGQIMAYAAANLTGGKGGSCSKVIDKLKGGDAETIAGLPKAASEWAASQSDIPADTEGLEVENHPEDEDIPFPDA